MAKQTIKTYRCFKLVWNHVCTTPIASSDLYSGLLHLLGSVQLQIKTRASVLLGYWYLLGYPKLRTVDHVLTLAECSDLIWDSNVGLGFRWSSTLLLVWCNGANRKANGRGV